MRLLVAQTRLLGYQAYFQRHKNEVAKRKLNIYTDTTSQKHVRPRHKIQVESKVTLIKDILSLTLKVLFASTKVTLN